MKFDQFLCWRDEEKMFSRLLRNFNEDKRILFHVRGEKRMIKKKDSLNNNDNKRFRTLQWQFFIRDDTKQLCSGLDLSHGPAIDKLCKDLCKVRFVHHVRAYCILTLNASIAAPGKAL